MTPTLIVLAMLALGVGIVAFATRRPPARPYEQRNDRDTAWSEPTDSDTPASDPFAHAPLATAETPKDAEVEVVPAAERSA